MKKVLIISFHFFNNERIASHRIQGLAKNLYKFDWEPTILTVTSNEINSKKNCNYKIIETPYIDFNAELAKKFHINPNRPPGKTLNIKHDSNKNNIFDRFWKFSKDMLCYPDVQKWWYKPAIDVGEKLLQHTHFDAIISSSSPYTSHLIAKSLSERYCVPWVADFRDLWTQNHYFSHSCVRDYFERKLELTIINQASTITIISQPLADKLNELHKSKPIHSIPNGFDPDMMNIGMSLNDQFRIVYTGVLYKGKRDPSQLFAVIKELCDDETINRQDIKIDFYGFPESWLQDESNKYQLLDIVTIFGQVPRETAIAEQRKAQILLLLTWDHPEEKGVYTGKLFDYLAARRPIISIGYTECGVVKELLDQTQAGVHVSNKEELRQYILNAYREYKEFGAVQYRGIEEQVMKYSHREMARKFAEVLDGITR